MTTAYVVILVFLTLVQILTIFMIHQFSTAVHKGMVDTSRHLHDLFDIIEGNRVMTKQEYDLQYGRMFADKGQKPTDE
jgi:hypothetical protein